MYKNILIILGVLALAACSQNKPEPEVKKKIESEVKTEVTPKVKKEIKAVVKKDVKELVKVEVEDPIEFIPEHIRRSSIEVVKHY